VLPVISQPAVSARSLLIETWSPRVERVFGAAEMERLLAEVSAETGVESLSEADFIIDVGYGIGNRDGYEEVILPLERALHAAGVANIAIGGSRKVTEELHVLPVDRQIGQSGVSVNPRILLAIGISGAPQHLSYIGQRATIIAFNRDPEAPLMTLNQRQPRPRVFSVVGDLFVTVPAFTAALTRTPPSMAKLEPGFSTQPLVATAGPAD
jgi:electron transfer flavoprotein alpha subunit